MQRSSDFDRSRATWRSSTPWPSRGRVRALRWPPRWPVPRRSSIRAPRRRLVWSRRRRWPAGCRWPPRHPAGWRRSSARRPVRGDRRRPGAEALAVAVGRVLDDPSRFDAREMRQRHRTVRADGRGGHPRTVRSAARAKAGRRCLAPLAAGSRTVAEIDGRPRRCRAARTRRRHAPPDSRPSREGARGLAGACSP